jgi:hypothetical protein
MLRKTLFLFLALSLLPACVEMPVFPASPTAPGVQQPEESLFRQAEAGYRRQAYRQALQQYAAYLERYPQGKHAIEARLREAELLGLLGDWQGSLRRYQSLLARQPEPEVAQKARYGIGISSICGMYPGPDGSPRCPARRCRRVIRQPGR